MLLSGEADIEVVGEASNGAEAVALAASQHPDVMLMDVRMPVMDGVQASRALKADDQLKTIPIIVVTASAMQSEEETLKTICDGFLRKPVSRADLAAKMRPFCRTRPGQRPSTVPLTARSPATGFTLAPDALAKLPALLLALGASQVRWETLMQAPLISEVEAFGAHLFVLAREHQNPPLLAYAEKLTGCAARFDMVGMETVLQGFEQLINNLRGISLRTT
jgi:two-component system CheB/CheR fusion protein